jgi:hypothetical protein
MRAKCRYCDTVYDVDNGHSCWEMRSGLEDIVEEDEEE